MAFIRIIRVQVFGVTRVRVTGVSVYKLFGSYYDECAQGESNRRAMEGTKWPRVNAGREPGKKCELKEYSVCLL